jgi:hypothetical protein
MPYLHISFEYSREAAKSPAKGALGAEILQLLIARM